jgi:outer membrane protein OmpA-like peptidoglycan-associated protein
MDISLEKLEVGEDLSKIIDIKPIYFDVGKSNIRPDAAVELDKIVKVMNENPNMVIELGSHTDSRGSASSNLSLSEKRAQSSADYIKARITNPERIYGKGFGETRLVNECADGVRCSKEKHQENRRTEFIIVRL